MNPQENIEKLIRKLVLPGTKTADERILNDALAAYEKSETEQTAAPRPNVWRIILKNKMTKFAAAALIVIAVMFGVNKFGFDSANKVFANAIDSVRKAKTLSCIESFGALNKKGTQDAIKQEQMFKSPNFSRYTNLSVVDGQFCGEVTITDYGKRKRLTLNPNNKTAFLRDISSQYKVDRNTGKLKLTELNTSLRDRLLDIRIKAVEDLGETTLNGNLVYLLQSRGDNEVTKVWIDPESGLPVQIEGVRKNRFFTYTSIKIDEVLNDDLFSLEPPDGYKLKEFTNTWPVSKEKIAAKIMYLLIECWVFAAKNNDQLPQDLGDLESTGVNQKVLNTILYAPDQQDGLPLITYLKPREESDLSREIMMYETFEEWPESGIVVGFGDTHCELITDQETFDALLKSFEF